MTITNRTRFKLWQWDKRNRAWLQTAGPDKREEMEFALGQRVNGARRRGMWGGAYCVLPVKEGAPLYAPERLIAYDIEGMSLEIVAQDETPEVEPQPATVDTAPQSESAPAPAPSDVDAVRGLLVGTARLRLEKSGDDFADFMDYSDFGVELDAAMRHLRNVERILRGAHSGGSGVGRFD